MKKKRDLDRYSKVYLGPFEEIQVKYRRKKVLEIISRFKPDNILEVGCGKDSIVNYIKEKEFKYFHIVEPIASFIEEAVDEKSPNIFLYNDFVENITEFRNIQFDLIIISSLLHELIEPHILMRTIFNISNYETIIHVNVPNANSFHRLLALEMGLINSIYEKSNNQKLLQQNSTFDINTLVELCKSFGFTVVEKGSYLIKPFTHLQMQQQIDNKIISFNVLDGLYKMVKYFPENGSEIFLNLKKNKV